MEGGGSILPEFCTFPRGSHPELYDFAPSGLGGSGRYFMASSTPRALRFDIHGGAIG